jgi:hypothetical protein
VTPRPALELPAWAITYSWPANTHVCAADLNELGIPRAMLAEAVEAGAVQRYRCHRHTLYDLAATVSYFVAQRGER